jgi:hypothetical protein
MSQAQQLAHSINFIDRDWELEAVDHRLNILRSGGSVFQCVLNFHGIPGIGKTSLLEEIQRRARENVDRGRSIATALIDLAAYGNRYRGGPESLADQMGQLEQQTHLSDTRFAFALKAFRLHPTPSDPYDEAAWYEFRQNAKQVADAFRLYVYHLAEEANWPVMLLMDNTDAAPEDVFGWMEHEVFSPLVQTGLILLVVAGRSPVRWKPFEIRRRVLLRKLNPPETHGLVRQEAAAWEHVAPNILKITFNYPPANQVVARELEQLGLPETIDETSFRDHRMTLIQRLMSDVIDKRLLAGVDADLRLVWRTTAPLRQLDVKTLRQVLPEFEPEFEGRGGNYYLLMLNRMVDTDLVEWSKERNAHVLDNTLRRFLVLDLETRDVDLALRIRSHAAEVYHQWLEEKPDQRSAYIVEWLYQRAEMARLEGKNTAKIASIVCNDLQAALREYYRPIMAEDDDLLDSAQQLIEAMKHDTDLPGLLGKESISRLVGEVEQAVPALKPKAEE